MRSVLAVITTICFALCQQFCLVAHACQETPVHKHSETDQHDHHHTHPGHKHAEEDHASRTAVPCCTIVKPTEQFSANFTLPAQPEPIALPILEFAFELFNQTDSAPVRAFEHGPPITLSHLYLSLTSAPNAPPFSLL